MIYILDPLTCVYLNVLVLLNYLPAIFQSKRSVIKRFGKKMRIKKSLKNFKSVTLTIPQMMSVTKHSSTNFQKSKIASV